ncbi:cation diffusion facilitator family transporter [Cerasicoccus arenae]|uniref:Cobalt transporter n=1 Tax=Cerasicoccus arenae TaxID=424488 RepID=A0A8J3GCL4_9BACT|nr:cation diffusion facilitator family transporter [Cerasicoccus arenae]MBK1856771.1 cation transporter [Cerasicoccus arenae]GHB99399.1 cobalt transporter [Cerasicoccus arenae]
MAHSHHDHAGHSHEGHSHSAKGIPKQRLLQALGISLIITVAQIIGGVISGSLALMSDALHTATDAVALLASFIAVKLGERPGSEKHTFGLKRAEIVAAAMNAGVLIGISLWLLYEATLRFIHPDSVKAGWMIGVAAIGLTANVINALLLQKGAKDNINMRSAYLHVLSDAVVSVGVILGGIAIMYLGKGFTWIDPMLTVLISLWLIKESWSIVEESIRIIMMGTPPGIEVKEVAAALTELKAVRGVHHLHIWSLNDQTIHFEAHIDIDDRLVSECSCVADEIEDLLHDKYEITHVTLQFESGRCEDEALIRSHDTL